MLRTRVYSDLPGRFWLTNCSSSSIASIKVGVGAGVARAAYRAPGRPEIQQVPLTQQQQQIEHAVDRRPACRHSRFRKCHQSSSYVTGRIALHLTPRENRYATPPLKLSRQDCVIAVTLHLVF